MSDIDIEEGRRRLARFETERAASQWSGAALQAHGQLAIWTTRNAAAMFDAIETGRQWETIARRLAAEVDWLSSGGTDLNGNAKKALAAFRDLADRISTPTDRP